MATLCMLSRYQLIWLSGLGVIGATIMVIALALTIGALLPAGEQIAYLARSNGTLSHLYLLDIERGIALKLVPKDGLLTLEIEPSWSSEGRQLRFMGRMSDRFELRGLDMITGQEKQILEFPAYTMYNQPALSPDALYIAYTILDTIKSESTLYVLDVAQNTAHKVGNWLPTRLIWSPDNHLLAFTTSFLGEARVSLIIVDAQTGTIVQQMLIGTEVAAGMSWSPDGTRIIYSASRTNLFPDDYDILSLELSTGRITNLTRFPAFDMRPVWSPDGQYIAFDSTRGGSSDIYVMKADGSEVRAVTHDPRSEMNPVWSPDGQRIIFQSFDLDDELYIIDVDGTNLRRLTDNSLNEMFPAWRPCAC